MSISSLEMKISFPDSVFEIIRLSLCGLSCTSYPSVEEREIVDTAKKYDLVGGGLDEKMNVTLRQIKDMKLELNTIIEVIPVFGSFAFNLIYPSEFNENVEMCADLVLDKLLPELQVILDKKIS